MSPPPFKSKSPTKNPLLESVAALEAKYALATVDESIKDIMAFCESPDLLNLPGSNLKLFPSQRIVLKCLYMGSRGNENLKLTAEEMQWLYDKKQDNVLEMIARREKGEQQRISELILVLGRRSSKTVIASIISAYEIYKLLKVGAGNPYTFYDIPMDKEIAVINVATSKKQAGRLFADVKARIRNSPFLNNRVANVTADEIRIYTDTDLQRKNDPNVNVPVDGSVLIVCGHSNPESLRGYAAICLLFDELAFYDESEKVSGSSFYNALKPSVGDFSPKGDGMTVLISSPGPKTGVFYKRWTLSLHMQNMLSFKMATWDFNPTRKLETDPELIAARESDYGSFLVEYGAEWPEGGMYGIYFPEELIHSCVRTDIGPEDFSDGRNEYYFHIDPGQGVSRYVIVIVKRSFYRDIRNKLMPRVILVYTKIWTPDSKMGLKFTEIDQEVLGLCRRFSPVEISYDQWNSIHSLEILREHGFMCNQYAYNRGYKQRIYQNLKDLMNVEEKALWLYDQPNLIQELKHLRYRPTPRGVSIGADTRGDCPTDDLADCLAGAAYRACGRTNARLPAIVTTYTGLRQQKGKRFLLKKDEADMTIDCTSQATMRRKGNELQLQIMEEDCL